MGKPATRAKNKYNARNYDRLNINVPQGDRELIRTIAEKKGMSINTFVTRLIYREIGKNPPF